MWDLSQGPGPGEGGDDHQRLALPTGLVTSTWGTSGPFLGRGAGVSGTRSSPAASSAFRWGGHPAFGIKFRLRLCHVQTS